MLLLFFLTLLVPDALLKPKNSCLFVSDSLSMFEPFSHLCGAYEAEWDCSHPRWSAPHQSGCCWLRPCCNLPPEGAPTPISAWCSSRHPPVLASKRGGHCHPDLSNIEQAFAHQVSSKDLFNGWWVHIEIYVLLSNAVVVMTALYIFCTVFSDYPFSPESISVLMLSHSI